MAKQVTSIQTLNIKDAMKLIGVSRTTLYRYIKSGQLPYRKIGHFVRFLASDLKTFYDRNKVDLSQPVTLQ